MRHFFWIGLLLLPIVGLTLAGNPDATAQGKKQFGPDPKLWDKTVNKAIKYLRDNQDKNNGWSTERTPGVTGIIVTGLLRTGKVTDADPMVAKALGYIESLVNTKAGHIAGKNPAVQLQNYVTCVNVMALVAAKRADKYEKIIGNAVKFLKQLQWDEGEGKSPQDPFYGGAGYDSKSRPDLSNTQMFLDALKDVGVSSDDPSVQKALIFVSRCQNLNGEHNDQPWAGRINDGSFIYTPANGGVTKVIDNPGPNDPRPGYGSMTYAGIKSMIYCGVDKNDPRIKTAYAWIKDHYTVDANPGMPGLRKGWGLYYYYQTMAKTLDVLGVDEVVDSKGQRHDWRKDITEALAKRQQPDGSWRGDPHWLESDPNLDTGYALMALSYCKPNGQR
jgi:squalene-hopene/tetraprenyl-beta-curcumene cyclase